MEIEVVKTIIAGLKDIGVIGTKAFIVFVVVKYVFNLVMACLVIWFVLKLANIIKDGVLHCNSYVVTVNKINDAMFKSTGRLCNIEWDEEEMNRLMKKINK